MSEDELNEHERSTIHSLSGASLVTLKSYDMLSSDPRRMESVLFFHSLIFISSVKLFTNKDACLVASLLFRFLVFLFCFV